MATPSHPFFVGQEVVLFDGNDLSRNREKPLSATITRVGRVNVAIERYGREVQFDIKDGTEKRSARAGGLGSIILTHEQWVEEKRLKAVIVELSALGISGRSGYPIRDYSADTLEQVRDILAADKAAREA